MEGMECLVAGKSRTRGWDLRFSGYMPGEPYCASERERTQSVTEVHEHWSVSMRCARFDMIE